jgi:hypothetical protein
MTPDGKMFWFAIASTIGGFIIWLTSNMVYENTEIT